VQALIRKATYLSLIWLVAACGGRSSSRPDPQLCIESQRARAAGQYAGVVPQSPQARALDKYLASCQRACGVEKDKAACAEATLLRHSVGGPFWSAGVIALCERERNPDACAWVAAHPDEVKGVEDARAQAYRREAAKQQARRSEPARVGPAAAGDPVKDFIDGAIQNAKNIGFSVSGPSAIDLSSGSASRSLVIQADTNYRMLLVGPASTTFTATLTSQTDSPSRFEPVPGNYPGVFALMTGFKTAAGQSTVFTVTITATSGRGKIKYYVFRR
jgi:hypothetical protein